MKYSMKKTFNPTDHWINIVSLTIVNKFLKLKKYKLFVEND